MYSKMRKNSSLALIVAIVSMFLISGCATNKLLEKDSAIVIEEIDSKVATISNAKLYFSKNQVLLRGEVKRRLPGRGAIPGHLHVAIISESGEIVKEADVRYIRGANKISDSKFNIVLPDDLSANAKIQITHFATKKHKVVSDETVWHDGDHH